MPNDWNQHEDLPILINASVFEHMPFGSVVEQQEFRRFTILYTKRCEDHIAHLVRLLEMKGIRCECTEEGTSPQCMIHVHDNLPEE